MYSTLQRSHDSSFMCREQFNVLYFRFLHVYVSSAIVMQLYLVILSSFTNCASNFIFIESFALRTNRTDFTDSAFLRFLLLIVFRPLNDSRKLLCFAAVLFDYGIR